VRERRQWHGPRAAAALAPPSLFCRRNSKQLRLPREAASEEAVAGEGCAAKSSTTEAAAKAHLRQARGVALQLEGLLQRRQNPAPGCLLCPNNLESGKRENAVRVCTRGRRQGLQAAGGAPPRRLYTRRRAARIPAAAPPAYPPPRRPHTRRSYLSPWVPVQQPWRTA